MKYSDAGVDVGEGRRAVDRMREAVQATHTSAVLPARDGFAGLYALSGVTGGGRGFVDPVLVSGADGVGTKVEVARALGRLDTIGIDCVAMCVNDVLCHGARPLFFLDYLAFGVLEAERAAEIVTGIAAGCGQAGCALIGGETAEMPGVYAGDRFDVAGFAVGVVERTDLWGPHRVRPGQPVVGIASSGLHSNGYSLVRALLGDVSSLNPWLTDELLRPTRIYARAFDALRGVAGVSGKGTITGAVGATTGAVGATTGAVGATTGVDVPVAAAAHITGGGWTENLPRMIPDGCALEIDATALPLPRIFRFLEERGVKRDEMYGTFNMGLGMALVLDADESDTGVVTRALRALADAGETAAVIGRVVAGDREVRW